MQRIRASRWALLGAALLTHAALAADPPPPSRASHAASSPTPAGSDLPPVVAREPSLAECQHAAARLAAGDASDDASRAIRARAAHWAPAVRGQLGGSASDRTRDGTMNQNPVHWTDLGGATTWSVMLSWDLPQAIYSRDESQLALATVHLARTRQAAAVRAAELYAERRRRIAALSQLAVAAGSVQLEAVLGLLETTAALDALTGGLFRESLARVQSRADALTQSLTQEPTP